MPLTAQQTQLARTIDTHVKQVLAHGGGDEALLLLMPDHPHAMGDPAHQPSRTVVP